MRLCINIDHIATLREARGGLEPDPVTAAHLCELYGAEGIVCHLREDRRHINDRDLRILRDTVKTKLDLEMAITDEIMGICIETLPDLATLVPERRQELTTEGGLDIVAGASHIAEAVDKLHDNDIEVSIFVDPVEKQIHAAAAVGADIVELHTGEYANARSEEEQLEQLQRVQTAATLARSLGLGVNAGHGLNYYNTALIAKLPEIDEVSIGHAIMARAVFVGLPAAVREMAEIIRSARP
jgi:pyridoxine 5-phosphate synthase